MLLTTWQCLVPVRWNNLHIGSTFHTNLYLKFWFLLHLFTLFWGKRVEDKIPWISRCVWIQIRHCCQFLKDSCRSVQQRPIFDLKNNEMLLLNHSHKQDSSLLVSYSWQKSSSLLKRYLLPHKAETAGIWGQLTAQMQFGNSIFQPHSWPGHRWWVWTSQTGCGVGAPCLVPRLPGWLQTQSGTRQPLNFIGNATNFKSNWKA